MRAMTIYIAAAFAFACGKAATDMSNRPVTLTITTSAEGLVRGAGADCRGTCLTQAAAGTQMHLAAVADQGASFSGWSGACGGTGGCDFTLDADRSVAASFSRPPPPPPPSVSRRLTVVTEGPGGVASSPSGIDCRAPGTCSASFSDGTSVSLTATPAAGATFAGWGGACSGPGGCSLVLSADRQVFAHFDPPPPPPPPVILTVSVSGSGVVNGAGINCGLGATTCRTTVATGTSVALTASAAGHVRFMGWSGTCSGTSSACSVTVNADSSVGASFEDEVRVIQPNDGRSLTTAFALNSTQVFFLRSMPQGWEIWSAPKVGGEAVRLVAGYASYLVADDGYLYWTDGYSLYSMPVSGGSVALLASATNIGKLALDGDGALYWTAGSIYQAGSVHRMQNRTDAVLASGQYPSALAVDASFAWFASKRNGEDGFIRRVPKTGGAVEDVANCQQCLPVVLRVDPKNFYYRNGDGDTWARGKDGGTPTLLSASNGRNPWSQWPVDLEVNASVVWWNWNVYGNTNGLFRANADGSSWTAVDTGADTTTWGALRVDDTAVYYFHGGALIKRLK